jgi:hypothetical protein
MGKEKERKRRRKWPREKIWLRIQIVPFALRYSPRVKD